MRNLLFLLLKKVVSQLKHQFFQILSKIEMEVLFLLLIQLMSSMLIVRVFQILKVRILKSRNQVKAQRLSLGKLQQLQNSIKTFQES